MSFSYSSYGLTINSAIPLPELISSLATPNRADIVVRLGSVIEPTLPNSSPSHFQLEGKTAHLTWRGVGNFVVRDGCDILIEAAPNADEATLRVFLLGPVLAIALQQRELLVLHSSAAAFQNSDGQWSAVGFLGTSGEGKSTMVAMLHSQGYRIIADDVIAVPIESSGVSPMIASGFPQLRLSAASVTAVGQDPQNLPLRASRERHVVPIHKGFATQKVPLRHLYVLETGETLGSFALSPAQSVVHLARHSYAAGSLSPKDQTAHFQQCAAVANCLRVHRLQRPRDLSLLSQIVQIIENDVADLD